MSDQDVPGYELLTRLALLLLSIVLMSLSFVALFTRDHEFGTHAAALALVIMFKLHTVEKSDDTTRGTP